MSFRYVFFDQRSADVNHPMRDRKDDLKNNQKNNQRVPVKTGTRRSHGGGRPRWAFSVGPLGACRGSARSLCKRLRGLVGTRCGSSLVPLDTDFWHFASAQRTRSVVRSTRSKSLSCLRLENNQHYFFSEFLGRYFDLRQRRNEFIRHTINRQGRSVRAAALAAVAPRGFTITET